MEGKKLFSTFIKDRSWRAASVSFLCKGWTCAARSWRGRKSLFGMSSWCSRQGQVSSEQIYMSCWQLPENGANPLDKGHVTLSLFQTIIISKVMCVAVCWDIQFHCQYISKSTLIPWSAVAWVDLINGPCLKRASKGPVPALYQLHDVQVKCFPSVPCPFFS